MNLGHDIQNQSDGSDFEFGEEDIEDEDILKKAKKALLRKFEKDKVNLKKKIHAE